MTSEMENAAPSSMVADIKKGWAKRELWLMLGHYDVRARYRRTKVGTFWISLSMVIIAGVMGMLYSAILHKPVEEYIPYLLTGFTAWNLLSALVSEGCHVFTANAAAMKEIAVPISVYVYRMLWRNLIIFLYNLLVYVPCVILFGLPVFPTVLLAIPALLCVFFNGMWIGLLFGVVNTRYRDFHLMVTHAMRLLFFITPIIWSAESISGLRKAFVHFNPFYYFIEILRAPMLGKMPDPNVLWVVLAITLIGWTAAMPFFSRWHKKLTYWV